MSIKLCCSLCCTPCNEYKQLQNETGEINEIYEITVKYFDPMFLTEERNTITANEHKVLCQGCWLHIEDFHKFQEEIIKTRSQLEEIDVKQLQIQIKLEHDEHENFTTHEENTFGNSGEEDLSQYKDVHIKNGLDEYDDNNKEGNSLILHEGNDVDDDDEQLLVPLQRITEKTNVKETEKTTVDEKTNSTCSNNEEKYKDDKSLVSHECNDDDDEQLLVPLQRTTEKTNVEEKSNSTSSNNEEKDTTLKLEEKPKSKRGRKPKDFVKDKVKLQNHEYKAPKKIKKLKQTKEIKEKTKINHILQKGKELDVLISQWQPQLECDICPETAATFNILRTHFRKIHKQKCYIKCCQRKFYRRCVLAEHVMLHINPEAHKCDICGKSSSTKNNLKLHKKIMHEDTQNYECEECHRVFNQKTTLDRHLLRHVTGNKDFICPECGKGFVVEILLNSHIRRVHNNDRVCDLCGKTVHGISALKQHLIEHGVMEKRKFPCDECGLELNSLHSMNRHKTSFHHDGTTIFVCSICKKVFPNENAIQIHKKLVHVERKHKCTYCDKAFKRPKVLREHIATHTGQDLYQCPHCPRTFKGNSHMHTHRKKVHPIEWAEGRKRLLPLPKVNINQVKKKVVL